MHHEYSIQQTGPTTWELRDLGVAVGAPFEDKPGLNGYEQACATLGVVLASQRLDVGGGEGATDGLLPERWTSDEGICFTEDTAGGRDFSGCEFSWRDPSASMVPFMLMEETSMGGHLGAQLAGFVEEFHKDGTTPHASGRLFDNEAGQQALQIMRGAGRLGVSVDPSEKVEAEFVETCVEYDDDGFCMEASYSVVFTKYEIAGITGCPIPCFERASVILEGTSAQAAAVPVRASGLAIVAVPPHEWLTLTEPQPGAPFLGGMGDDVLVPQRDSFGDEVSLACPLTIRDDGLVFGHLTYWGQCHVADPWGPGVCASARPSANGYADFMSGETVCADGSRVATGVLTVGCEHSAAMDVRGVRDHLAHSGMGWASVRVVDGEFGPWLCGVLRPDLTESQVRLLRSLALSGEWVGELGGVLSVNKGGLPVQRSLAASAFPRLVGSGENRFEIPELAIRSSVTGGVITKLLGGNIVRSCPECEKRRLAAAATFTDEDRRLLRAVASRVETLDRRTEHLRGAAAADLADELTSA